MDALTAWFRDYWKYAVVLVIVAVATVLLWIRAIRAHRAHQTRFHAEEEKLRRMTELKTRYSELTDAVIADAPQEELLEGVALHFQLWLQKQPDLKAAFASLPEEVQYVYALDVLTSDGVCVFFQENGAPLLQVIAPAFAAIGLKDETARVKKLALMYDETDETTSLDASLLAETEKDWAQRDLLTQIKLSGAEYIKNHPRAFQI